VEKRKNVEVLSERLEPVNKTKVGLDEGIRKRGD